MSYIVVFLKHTISQETFEGENFRGSVKSELFGNKIFAECKVNRIHVGGCRSMLKFEEKTFASSFEAANL